MFEKQMFENINDSKKNNNNNNEKGFFKKINFFYIKSLCPYYFLLRKLKMIKIIKLNLFQKYAQITKPLQKHK